MERLELFIFKVLWSFLGAIAFLVWLSTIATLIVLFLAVAYLVDLLVWVTLKITGGPRGD